MTFRLLLAYSLSLSWNLRGREADARAFSRVLENGGHTPRARSMLLLDCTGREWLGYGR
jgi:hypothetical protein